LTFDPESPYRLGMDRRRFLAAAVAGVLAAPRSPAAQPAGKVYRIGMLETRSILLNSANLEAFRQGLRTLGYVEGKNLAIEYRSSDGRDDRFAALASELIQLPVDLIVTRGTPAALATKSATQTIPVVMAAAGDPVRSGLVASLSRPGGNITGCRAGSSRRIRSGWSCSASSCRASSDSLRSSTWAIPRSRPPGSS
jgi:putative ABC transport system substrate-binding protein